MLKNVTQIDRGCWWGAVGMVSLLAVLVPACGGSSEGGPSTAAPIALEALPQKLASATCENIAGCCQSAAIPFDLATCRANAEADIQKLVNSRPSPQFRYDAAAAGECASTLAAAYKSCFYTGSDDAVAPVCGRIFVGTSALGEHCTTSTECALGADGFGHCEFTGGDRARGGVCVAQEADSVSAAPHGKRGEACASTCQDTSNRSDCGAVEPGGTPPQVTTVCFMSEGLQCDPRSRTCQPLVENGGACHYLGCVAGTYCTSADVCAPLKADGAACDGRYECLADSCVYPTNSTTGGICKPKPFATPSRCSGSP